MRKLVAQEFDRTAGQMKDMHGIDFQISQEFRDAVSEKGFDVRYGARPLKRAWKDIVETPLADWMLRQSGLALRRAEILEMVPDGQIPANDSVVVPLVKRPAAKPVPSEELKPAFVVRSANGPA